MGETELKQTERGEGSEWICRRQTARHTILNKQSKSEDMKRERNELFTRSLAGIEFSPFFLPCLQRTNTHIRRTCTGGETVCVTGPPATSRGEERIDRLKTLIFLCHLSVSLLRLNL